VSEGARGRWAFSDVGTVAQQQRPPETPEGLSKKCHPSSRPGLFLCSAWS